MPIRPATGRGAGSWVAPWQTWPIYTIVYNQIVGRLSQTGDLDGRESNPTAGFPKDVRADAGYQLELVQEGLTPTDFRPMPDVGPGVMEIRVHSGNEYRVFYVARFVEGIYVLHCFIKKIQRTPVADIELGQRRYRAVLETRKNEGYTK